MDLTLLLDGVLIVLVGAGIFFAWRLQRALTSLQQNRQAMEGFIGTFVTSITRAEKAIAELNGTARNLSEDIDGQMKKAGALRDELVFLVDAADKVASRLTDQTTQAQSASRASRKEAAREKMPEETAIEKPVVSPVPEKQPEAASLPAWAKRLEDDGRVINKLPNPQAALPEQIKKEAPRPRSQAERDLQQALEKIR